MDLTGIKRSSRPTKLRTKQIMVVDEDAATRAVVRETLEPLGYGIIGASICADGIKALAEVVIDLVIADIFMSSTISTASGVTWGIQEVRKHQASTKVVALSASWGVDSGRNLADSARRMGADLVLTKPLSAPEVEEAVLSLLGGPIEMAELAS